MNAPAKVLRDEIRAGRHTTVTTGLAPGHVQANLVILPADWAREFAEFCAANWRRRANANRDSLDRGPPGPHS